MAAKVLLGGYLLVVALVAAWMAGSHRGGGVPLQKGRAMIAPIPWQPPVKVPVPALPTTGLWTPALDFVPEGALLKLEASGKWSYSTGMETGPDGDLAAILTAAQALAPKAPVGSLIAKIGGSTAAVDDGSVFIVGSKAVIRLKGEIQGPLYLTINDHVTGLSDNTGSLEVKVSLHVPPPPPKSESSDGKSGGVKVGGGD
jgi:hypothetical protein